MTLEQVGLLLSLLIGGGGLAVGIGALVYAKRAASVSQKELDLAIEQAAMRPIVKVRSMRLLEVGDVDGLLEEIRDIEEDREEREAARRRAAEERRREEARKRKEKEDREAEEESQRWEDPFGLRKLGGLSYRPQFDIDSSSLGGIRIPDHMLSQSDPYEGPVPDKVLRVVLVNSGRTAAYEVAGWLAFDPAHVEPQDYFCDGWADERGSSSEPFRVRIGGGEKDNLLPTSNDYLAYDIALKVRSAGTTSVGYEFVSSAGKGSEGSREVEMPAG